MQRFSKCSPLDQIASIITILLIVISSLVGVTLSQERVSYNIYVVGEDRSLSGSKLEAAGHNVVWQPDALQIKLANLSVFDQVWFVDIFAVPDATGRANLVNFIKSGGKLFFVGDSYKPQRAPLYAWRDSIFNELGAGGVKQSADVNPSQTVYYTNPFHVTSYSPNTVRYIEHGEGRNGSFEQIGNGRVIVGAGLDATGDAIALAFNYGDLTEAVNSRAIIYLNSNNTTNWDLFVENLAKFLGPKDKTVLVAHETKALPDGSGHLRISLHNSREVSGIQLNLQDVPDVFTPIQISTTDRTINFSISYEENAAGVILMVISSEIGGTILPGTGAIIDLVYSVNPDVEMGDSAEIVISDAIVSDRYEVPLITDVMNGKFYCDVLKGDVITDGIIDVIDLVRVIDIILGRPPEATDIEREAADYNSDSEINILDVVAIINNILGREPAALQKNVGNKPGAWNLSRKVLDKGHTQINLPFQLIRDEVLIAAQLTISYDDEKVAIGEPVLMDRAADMTLASYDQDGKLTILIFSADGNSILPENSPVFTLPLSFLTDHISEDLISVDNLILIGEDFQPITLTNVETFNLNREIIPTKYNLLQNYPNPFNLQTEIQYSLPVDATVTLTIYNLLGEEIVKLLHNQEQSAGHYRVHWDGCDKSGVPVSSGIYLYRLLTPDYTNTRKLTVLK